jgi:two-component system sensor histidine kinase DesK
MSGSDRPIAAGNKPIAVGNEQRFRYGWILAAIWLGYLGETLNALTHHRPGWERVLGLVALGAFVVAYLLIIDFGRRAGRTGEQRPLAARWLQIGLLVGLFGLMIPGAGHHALTALVYITAVTMMSVPIRQAIAAVAVIFVAAEGLPRVVHGWPPGSGYGFAVLLAGVAVWGVRVAIERNRRLAEAQGELARLAIENERARIAGDLHDILGHSLTVMTVKTELAQRLLDIDPERTRAELRDLEMLCRDALSDVRATVLGVRGVSLAGEIAAAREALAAADVHADLPTAADEVPSRWRELFAWTIREAVTNLVRHSRATHCQIRLTAHSVEVLDDGVGAAGAAAGSGQGLAGLRRRAEALGARLSVGDRADAPGFRVLVEAPS